MHCGKGVLIDKLENLHGETFNFAYHIGEDLCEGGSVMVSTDVIDILKKDAAFNGASYVKLDEDDKVFTVAGKVEGLKFELVPTDDGRFLHKSLL